MTSTDLALVVFTFVIQSAVNGLFRNSKNLLITKNKTIRKSSLLVFSYIKVQKVTRRKLDVFFAQWI